MENNTEPSFSTIETGRTGFNEFEKEEKATYKGIGIKTIFMFLLAVISGSISAALIYSAEFAVLMVLMFVGAIAALIAALIGLNNPKAAKVCSVIYALGEGIGLGMIVCLAELAYPGIGFAAILSTLAIFFVILMFFSMGYVKSSSKLRVFVLSVLIGSVLVSLVVGISSIFTDTLANLFFGTSTFALILAVIMLVVSALALIIDFDNASVVVNSGASKNAEWQVSLGLMISVVYIFYRVIRVLLIIAANSRKN